MSWKHVMVLGGALQLLPMAACSFSSAPEASQSSDQLKGGTPAVGNGKDNPGKHMGQAGTAPGRAHDDRDGGAHGDMDDNGQGQGAAGSKGNQNQAQGQGAAGAKANQSHGQPGKGQQPTDAGGSEAHGKSARAHAGSHAQGPKAGHGAR